MGMRTQIPAAVIASARSVMSVDARGEIRNAAQNVVPGTAAGPGTASPPSAPDTRKEQG
jgi:hypothetical protein